MTDQVPSQDGAKSEESRVWLRKGYSFEGKRRYEEAIECYDKALAIIPDSADALGAKGWALVELERYEEAISYFEKALEIKPKVARFWNNMGVAFEDSGKIEEAIKFYDKAIEIRSNFMFPWQNKGCILNNMGKYEEALSCFDRALKIKPKNDYVLNEEGRSLLCLDRFEEAIISFDKAISINRKNAEAWTNRGIALYYLTRYKESVDCSDIAIELEPENESAWLYKGMALNGLEKFGEAIICFDQALKIDPDNFMIWQEKGNSLANLERHDEAIKCYEKALEMEPNESYLWNGIGCSLYFTKKYDEAIEAYDKAINLYPEEPLFWNNKGESLLEIGKNQEALNCYDRAIELDKEDPECWSGKGKALKALGRNEEAEEAFKRAKEFEEKNSEESSGSKDIPKIIERIESVLKRKGQLILYGPPGTGKTYWAMNAARELAAISMYGTTFAHLSENQKNSILGDKNTLGVMRICSFHPAYGYEDFIEGYRPELGGDGQISFTLKEGIFKKICGDALKNPDTSFYLIIDEINRGDIPRIFGELITVLEKNKRNKSVILPLSKGTLNVPHNVYLIGTMNTADRSIALLDTALRRRFGFIELMPDVSLFENNKIDGIHIGKFLNSLNNRICEFKGRDARNYQIGHSYFLENGQPISDFSKLAQIIQDDIIPLLEEYCYEDYLILGKILGHKIIDDKKLQICSELFEEGYREELNEVLKSIIIEDTILNNSKSDQDASSPDDEM